MQSVKDETTFSFRALNEALEECVQEENPRLVNSHAHTRTHTHTHTRVCVHRVYGEIGRAHV